MSNGACVGWRRMYGLLATAAVADMPVGAPPPFASALEQAPDRTRTSGAWPGSAMTASAARSRSRLQSQPTKEDLTPI